MDFRETEPLTVGDALGVPEPLTLELWVGGAELLLAPELLAGVDEPWVDVDAELAGLVAVDRLDEAGAGRLDEGAGVVRTGAAGAWNRWWAAPCNGAGNAPAAAAAPVPASTAPINPAAASRLTRSLGQPVTGCSTGRAVCAARKCARASS